VYFPFSQHHLDDELNYLDFVLKPNDYLFKDWLCLFSKIQKRISFWAHQWLSRGGRLVLLNVVLNSIPVYWESIEKIQKGILHKIRELCFQFLWLGNVEKRNISLVKWSNLSGPRRWVGGVLRIWFGSVEN
jgi:hypothetical protein